MRMTKFEMIPPLPLGLFFASYLFLGFGWQNESIAMYSTEKEIPFYVLRVIGHRSCIVSLRGKESLARNGKIEVMDKKKKKRKKK